MRLLKRGDLLDQAFLVGIVLKGLDGVLEVVGGLLLLVVTPATTSTRTTEPASWRRWASASPSSAISACTRVACGSGALQSGRVGS